MVIKECADVKCATNVRVLCAQDNRVLFIQLPVAAFLSLSIHHSYLNHKVYCYLHC